jgi:HAD superfamily hydrolase (TIGR01484 family)
VLVSASAIGVYGDTGSVPADESSPPAADFLADVCVRWEEQALAAEALGVRVVRLRIGVVLDARGGALVKIAKPFRFFAGGPVGGGRQYVSWIHWRDLVGLVDLALADERLSGAVNAVAPSAVTNRHFARVLGRVLGRPSWLPAPGFALRFALGEFARYALMSQRIVPSVAVRHGYAWHFPELEPAVRQLLLDPAEPTAVPAPGADEPARPGETAPPDAGPAPAPDGAGPAARVRLLAIDVDGTLLRSDMRIAQGVIQACRAAERAGCVVVLATARAPRTMRALVDALNVVGPTINYHGAVIWNPIDDRAQYHEALPGEVARAIIGEARRLHPEVLVGVEVLDRWYVDGEIAAPEGEEPPRPDLDGPLERIIAAPVTRLDLRGEPRAMRDVAAVIRERFWTTQQVSMFVMDAGIVQILHRLADKSIALQRIAQHLGVTREQVMAIGDGANDLGMIEWSGFGVAVANAVPAVKEMADAIVPSNDDLGVARAIQRFVLHRP